MEDKRMKRRTWLFLSLLVVAGMLLAACGVSPPPVEEEAAPAEEEAAAGKTYIVANRESCSFRELTNAAAAAVGYRSEHITS